VAQAPVIDGRILDDPAWTGANVLTDFWQTASDGGQRASELHRPGEHLIEDSGLLYDCGLGPRQTGRSVTVKISRMFDLLD
jgi:hypothetical protein